MESVVENLEVRSRRDSLISISSRARALAQELLPNSRPFIGIEFDRSLIKLILVGGRGAKEHVRDLQVKFLSSEREEEIRMVLQEVLSAMGIKRGMYATISIPRHSVHAKVLRLPSHDREELRKMVTLHIQKDIPLPLQELVCDFRVVAREDEGYARVMVVFARRREVEHYLELCTSVGLKVEAIRLNIEATYQCFLQSLHRHPEFDAKCMALVDIDFSATNVLIMDRGDLLYCRSVGKGVGDLMERMVGPFRNAEHETWIDELSRGVADTIAIFQKNALGGPVEYIALTGWMPQVNKLTEIVMHNLNVPVCWFDPVVPSGPLTDASDGKALHHWFSISTLLGMAQGRHQNLMDLRPAEERRQQYRGDLMRKGLSTGLHVVCLLLLLFATVKFALHERNLAVTRLQEKFVALKPKVEYINKWDKVRQALQKQLGTPEHTSAVLGQLLDQLPPGIELNSLTFKRGEKLVVRGVGGSFADVFYLPTVLAGQPSFDKAIITSADRQERQGAKAVVQFEMRILLHVEKNREATVR